ncbi:MAG: hypothetical protein JW958_10305 [Candidatus Eisenbacteria bacterium]|nr:hypothetical protein [Candidatus Eisenbacteria bacterium]
MIHRRSMVQAVVFIVLGILVALFMRSRETRGPNGPTTTTPAETERTEEARPWTADLPAETTGEWRADLPRLLVLAGDNEESRDMKAAVDRLAGEYEDRAVVAYLDLPVHRDREKTATKTFPTTVLIDRYGNETWRKEGFVPVEELEAKLREACR